VTRRIRAAKPASEELTAAVAWYERQRPGLGRQFYEATLATVDRILDNPEAGPIFGASPTRRMLVSGFPYQVVYRLTGEDIRILAFAHLKRRPDFWRHRR
jgi:plasmid stabilization system protein ParE